MVVDANERCILGDIEKILPMEVLKISLKVLDEVYQ